jgi:Uncharacterized conserved protein
MNSDNVKQVLILRKDLKVRRGKEISQGAHGSLGVVLNAMRQIPNGFFGLIIRALIWMLKQSGYRTLFFMYKRNTPWDRWLNGRFTKICVYCKDEIELLEIYKKHKLQEFLLF